MTSERPIGGEMEIYPSAFGLSPKGFVWPGFGKTTTLRCDTGRSAFILALRDWKKRSGGLGRVWLPDYLCSSMAGAVLSEGFPLLNYQDQPGACEFRSPPLPIEGDIVVIVHYFGLVNRNALDWLQSCSSRNWNVLEDCVQAPYSLGVGQVGDYVITSLRKWWPAPDGAVLCSDMELLEIKLGCPNENFIGPRLAAQLLKGASGNESLYLDWIQRSEECLENVDPSKPSWISQTLLDGVNVPKDLARRLENWHAINHYISLAQSESFGVIPLYETLPEGTFPLVFPIRVVGGKRDRLRSWLVSRKIYCPIHWHLPDTASNSALLLSGEMLGLPIDQRYNRRDMRRVVEMLVRFFEGENQ